MFKVGDILIDPRDKEVSRVVKIDDKDYHLVILRSGNGGLDGKMGMPPVGEEVYRDIRSVNTYKLDESFKVRRILENYGDI